MTWPRVRAHQRSILKTVALRFPTFVKALSTPRVMPLIVLTAEQRAAAEVVMDDELDFLRQEKGVPKMVRSVMAHV